MKKKEKTYLVFTEQCDDETLSMRMTGDMIREELRDGSLAQVGTAIVEGNLIKSFDGVIDLSKL